MVAGDRLTVGNKESRWEGWLWCTDEQGQSRWIPERYLEVRGDVAIALRAYDATELTVKEGERVTGGELESDWFWCISLDGQSGWVPLENLVKCNHGEGD
jgi:hypothetical protein